ncbi:hypothetical protein PN498_28420 [Oscillatoria sp. CS-180]|uniref:hypothetical protein n=1 Tax=Oscillatoria sp. CS-180 TaxID=3021720 RepID=UPI00232DB752|nr:hypothetical protein [Oscillatoria sp. CS-180]MDB9529945.1 hypothetical protein [Oscillatoria sp. CS-180]
MTNQNSVVVPQIRPEQAMEQLGLKKDAYYDDLKFLGIKANRDSDGKSYLDEAQFQLLAALRQHVTEIGKRDGFQMPGELATVVNGDMAQPEQEPVQAETHQAEQFDIQAIISEAAELAGSRMTMREQVVNAIAEQLSYDDLPPAVQAKVQSVRAAADPKAQPRQVATALLSQWRQQRTAVAA